MRFLFRTCLLATALSAFAALLLSAEPARAEPASPYVYISPQAGAALVSPQTAIAVRSGERIQPASISGSLFLVEGSRSGLHEGAGMLANDGETVVFQASRPFDPGETVRVTIAPGLLTEAGHSLPATSFEFSTWGERPPQVSDLLDLAPVGQGSGPAEAVAVTTAPATFETLPPTYPVINVTLPTTDTVSGYYFLTNISRVRPYLMVIDGIGDPVYYQQLMPPRIAADFKVQPNGLLTYYDSSPGVFYGMDETYTIVRTFKAGNGYRADHHDLQVLPNGHYLVMIWDTQLVDMSKIVPGGKPDAYVYGLIVQELDAAGLVVFEWRSWDHLEITDSDDDLTGPVVDPFHGNSIEPDRDGNLLLSARNFDQVIKINRQTGAIMWRLGGKKNEFTLWGDDQFFRRQHDVRRLPNGHLTLFDNRAERAPQYSRAVEYLLDEAARKVTRIWDYRNTPDVYGAWLGNTQRLPNDNTVISWGISVPAVTEVRPDGTKVFEMSLANVWTPSYRIFRFPWHGRPTWPPAIAVRHDGGRVWLYFSYNGATEVASYLVLAGTGYKPDTPIAKVLRTRFEDSFDSTAAYAQYCSFRVMPLDKQARETIASAVVLSPRCLPHGQYLPGIATP